MSKNDLGNFASLTLIYDHSTSKMQNSQMSYLPAGSNGTGRWGEGESKNAERMQQRKPTSSWALMSCTNHGSSITVYKVFTTRNYQTTIKLQNQDQSTDYLQ